MKPIKILPLLSLIFVLTLLYGAPGCDTGPPTSELFEQAWSDFDQHYSYFTYKNVDWNAVKTQYAPNFQEEMNAEDFAVKLNEVLQVLHDWHVSVESPKGQAYGYNGNYNVNRPEWSVISPYITDGVNLANDTITHGFVGNNIAYIDISSLSINLGDDEVEQIFQRFADAGGMIIDLRANNGGNEEIAAKFSSRIIEETLLYGYTKTRNGPNHDDFDPPEEHAIDPSTGTHFSGKVVGLIGKRCMSSAEWFTLMMKAAPNATLIGERTRGASGFPQEYKLPNNVSYEISSWMAYTYYDEVIEDKGIAPDITIPYEQSFDDTHDYVLERAISFLENGETVTTTVPGSTVTTTMPGGGGTTTMPGGATTTSIPGGGGTTTVPGGPATTTTEDSESTTTIESGSGNPVIDSFTINPPSGSSETQFVLTCSAHAGEGRVITIYYWDFDDDKIADDFSPTGIYYLYGFFLESGTNIINVAAQDDMGNLSDIASDSLTIE